MIYKDTISEKFESLDIGHLFDFLIIDYCSTWTDLLIMEHLESGKDNIKDKFSRKDFKTMQTFFLWTVSTFKDTALTKLEISSNLDWMSLTQIKGLSALSLGLETSYREDKTKFKVKLNLADKFQIGEFYTDNVIEKRNNKYFRDSKEINEDDLIFNRLCFSQ